MNNKALMTCAALLGLACFTSAQAASSNQGETQGQPVLMAELSTGKTSRIAVPVPRPDRHETLTTESGDAHAPIARTKSGIRIIGVPFFPVENN